MKSSSAWISGSTSSWDDGRAIDVDSNGWVRSLQPGQLVRRLMLREIGDRYPGGQYIVRYNGEGVLKFAFAAKVISQKPGEMVIDVVPHDGGIHVSIEQTNPANYLRDIEIIMPGGICEGDPFTHVMAASACAGRPFLSFADHHQTILFYPPFLGQLRNYSVLRFMDWMSTNNSPVTQWSERLPMTYSTWSTTSGVPIEVMIALSNVLGAHPWFNMPHQADDVYVQNFAHTVQARLNPDLRVYVEYSNEVWNPDFKQNAYATVQAAAHVPTIDLYQYHAQRSRTVGQIFKATLGESRVVAVLGAQAANSWIALHGLEYLQSKFTTYSSIGIDAVAIAPYFGYWPNAAEASKYSSLTLDEFFDLVRKETLPMTREWTTKHQPLVKQYGVRLLAYEGGQHMAGRLGGENDVALNKLFDDFNRDPRLKQLYLEYLAGWKQAGGELFCHFVDVSRYTKWGRWGALEYVTQPRASAPKFDALQTFVEQNPVWWPQ